MKKDNIRIYEDFCVSLISMFMCVCLCVYVCVYGHIFIFVSVC